MKRMVHSRMSFRLDCNSLETWQAVSRIDSHGVTLPIQSNVGVRGPQPIAPL